MFKRLKYCMETMETIHEEIRLDNKHFHDCLYTIRNRKCLDKERMIQVQMMDEDQKMELIISMNEVMKCVWTD